MSVKFTRKKLLTRPTLSLKKEGVEVYFKIEGLMYTGKEMKEKLKEGEKPKEPATLLDIINLESGEQMQLVVPAMLKSVLHEDYENEYVGKCFYIKNMGKVDTKAGGGQRFNQLHIEEIEVSEESHSKAEKVKAVK